MNQEITRGLLYNKLTGDNQERIIINELAETISCIEGLVIERTWRASANEIATIRRKSSRIDKPTSLDTHGLYYLGIKISYNGRELPETVYAPVLIFEPGNAVRLNGTLRYFGPVIAKKGFSLGETAQKIYIWLNRTSWTFDRHATEFTRNGVTMNRQFLKGFLYKGKDATEKRTNDKEIKVPNYCPVVLYLLGEYGLTESFKRYFGADVIIEDAEYEDLEEKYPSSKYYVYQPSETKVNEITRTNFVRSTAAIVIPKMQWDTSNDGIIAGIMYVVNIMSHLINDQWVSQVDNTQFWRKLLGTIIWNTADDGSADSTLPVLLNKVNAHFTKSIQVMIDKTTLNEFRLDSFNFNNASDIFAHMLLHMVEIYNCEEVNSLYDKRICLARYAMKHLSEELNQVFFGLNKLTPDPSTGEIDPKKISRALKRINGLIYSKISRTNGESFTQQTECDNMYMKITSTLVPQEKHQPNNKSGHKTMAILLEKYYQWHPSYHHIARALQPGKNKPTCGEFINPFVDVTDGGEIIYSRRDDKQMEELVDIMREAHAYLPLPRRFELEEID